MTIWKQHSIRLNRFFLLNIALAVIVMSGQPPTPKVALSQPNHSSPGPLPLAFVPNAGQSEASIAFEAISRLGTLAFGANEVTLATDEASLRVQFLGANEAAHIVGRDQLPGVVNYYAGADPAQWRDNLPTYGAIIYDELYAGIDLTYNGHEGALKGTYTIEPGHSPDQIHWRYDGADRVTVDPTTGDLHIDLGTTRLVERAPIAWQNRSGVDVPIEVRFAAQRDGSFGFVVDEYDASLPLILDPTLIYGTYLGALSDDIVHDIGLDTAGNIYLTGWTYNNNLGGFPNTRKGSNDAFVAKLNAAGTAWQWVTYLGGDQDDKGYGLAVDGNSAVWVTGETNSTNFPVTANALQGTSGGGYDAILTRLNAATGAVTYSTLYGFDLSDRGQDVAIDGQGNVYLTGQLNANDVLTMKLSGGADPALVYGVHWGDDTGVDEGYAIAVNSVGRAYITGMTENASASSSFPLVNAVQTVCGPYTYDTGDKDCTQDAFVSVINAAGDLLVYSTLLGGGGSPHTSSGADEGRSIALDNDGNIYVTGFTYSTDFPTVNAAYANYPDEFQFADAWLTKLSPNGQTIVYSTYLGGDGDDEAQSLVVDKQTGSAYVAGYTRSTDFPHINPIQDHLMPGGACFTGATLRLCYDAFLAKFTATGQVAWSTYLGGAFDEYAYSLTRDGNGVLYLAGQSESLDYPTTTGAAQRDSAGNVDGFITKITEAGTPPPPTFTHHVYLPTIIR